MSYRLLTKNLVNHLYGMQVSKLTFKIFSNVDRCSVVPDQPDDHKYRVRDRFSISTHPLSGSRAMSLGLSNPKESTLRGLFPAKSDIDIVSDVVSVQYNSDVLHCTANPSHTPILLIIVVMPDPSMPERFMFRSLTSLQNMYPMLKWTSRATALFKPETTEWVADVL